MTTFTLICVLLVSYIAGFTTAMNMYDKGTN